MRSGDTQSVPTATPNIYLEIQTGTPEDVSSDVIKFHFDEQAYGGVWEIWLDNSDSSYAAKDYKGYKVDLRLGFSGGTPSQYPDLWIDTQSFESVAGKLTMKLTIIDAWGLLAKVKPGLGNAQYNQEWQTRTYLTGKKFPSGGDVTEDFILAVEDQYGVTAYAIIGDMVGLIGLAVDAGDKAADGVIDALIPPSISVVDPRSTIIDCLGMTQSFLLWKDISGTSKFTVIKEDEHASVHTFALGDNELWEDSEDSGITTPNKVQYFCFDEAGTAWIGGTAAEDSTSQTRLGLTIPKSYLLGSLHADARASEASLTSWASATLAKLQGQRALGTLYAPMHCSLELFDQITITDTRYSGTKTITGYVHRLIRDYEANKGIYSVNVVLGGVASGYTPSGGALPVSQASLPVPTPMPLSTASIYPAQLWQAVQPYTVDIDFSQSSTTGDNAHMSWGSGNIYFKDGTSLAIDANADYAIGATPGWLYFTEEDSTLNFTTDFATAIAAHNGIVAFVARGTEAGETALILPSNGKAPLLNADIISCIYLSAIAASMGTLNAGTINIGKTGSGLNFNYASALKGFIYTLANEAGIGIFGNPDLAIDTAANGGITLKAGGVAASPTDNALRLLAAGHSYLGSGNKAGSPAGNDLWLDSDDDIWMFADSDIILQPVSHTYIDRLSVIQEDVSASRVIGTVYQNTTVYPKFVNVAVTLGAYGSSAAYVELNDATPDDIVSDFTEVVGETPMVTHSFIVPVGAYYKVVGGTKQYWNEIKIGASA